MPSFELAEHHRLLVSRLEAVEAGVVKRLAICVPPRHGKTVTGSQFFPAWALGRRPERHVLLASYSAELAEDNGRKVRNLIADGRHGGIFPESKLAADSSAAHRFNTTEGGGLIAVGRGGSATGFGADIAIVDDPLKDRAEASSEAIRKELHEWFSFVVLTRLTPDGRAVVISSRWHEDDLVGRLVREQPGVWDVVSLPALAEANDPLGREEGTPLWPSRFGRETLERIREEIGTAAWAALYQQRPAPLGGAIFRAEWFRSYREPPASLRVIQSWDSAFKTATANDYSVCVTLGESKTGYHVLHVLRGRWEFPDLVRRMRDAAETWKPAAVVVEDAASGQSVAQVLKAETRLPVIGVKPQGSKILRAQLVAPTIESGRVWLPEAAPWKSALVDELASFPSGQHDDQVDALVHGLTYLRGSVRAGPFRFIAAGTAHGGADDRWRGY
jgi:predicted phage terminase large subunit-like protein